MSRNYTPVVWKKLVPHIKVRGLRTDICNIRDQYASEIYTGSIFDRTIDIIREKWTIHRKRAEDDLNAYKARVKASNKIFKTFITEPNSKYPARFSGTRVVTFDFAQSVALPYYLDQASPTYFKANQFYRK